MNVKLNIKPQYIDIIDVSKTKRQVEIICFYPVSKWLNSAFCVLCNETFVYLDLKM